MIEECAHEWTPRQAKWLDSVLSSADGRRFIAYLRHFYRAKPLNLTLEPNIDYTQVNAFMNRDREAWGQVIDKIVQLSEVKEKKEPPPSAIRQLIREPEKEPPIQPRKKR